MTMETVFVTIGLTGLVLTGLSFFLLFCSMYFVDHKVNDTVVGFFMIVAVPALVMDALAAFILAVNPPSQYAEFVLIYLVGVVLALLLMMRLLYLWISVPRCPCAHAESAKKAA